MLLYCVYVVRTYITRAVTLSVVEYGHDIEEMLQECVFMGQMCGPQ